jgi:methylenetetrahydrofolate reductase (NADPH)
MHIKKIFEQNNPTLSFEFFPPRTPEDSQNLFNRIQTFVSLKPSFVSVTFGAGGSTRDLTRDLVVKLHRETNLNIVAHLTCVGASKEETHRTLQGYYEAGIENVMALRGDPPKGSGGFVAHPNGFRYASELVSLIRKYFPTMGIGVAGFPEGHPEMPNRLKEMEFLKAKVDAGADYICTQLFYDNHDFYDFCERCEIAGIKIPIIAGIMPVTSLNTMKRIADLALGARFPAKLVRALTRAESDDYVVNVGIHWATEQVRDLLDNKTRGIHFYTLNKELSTVKICENLGIRSFDGLRK